jgi:hypothetical protein
VPSGAAGTVEGSGKLLRRSWARVKPGEGDDRWGPSVSRARRGAKGGPKAGALSCDGGENRARAPPAHEPAGLTDKGGGPGISGPAQKVWAGWAKFNGEF